MAKTIIPAGACSEPGTKSRLEIFDIDALRKPLKMTATLKRRALKKKPNQKTTDGFRTTEKLHIADCRD